MTIISEGIAALLALDPSLEVIETHDIDEIKCIAIVLHDIEIVDLYLSSCARFDVDPSVEYGIPLEIAAKLAEINQAIRESELAAIQKGAKAMMANRQ
jgi:hypothetical protein